MRVAAEQEFTALQECACESLQEEASKEQAGDPGAGGAADGMEISPVSSESPGLAVSPVEKTTAPAPGTPVGALLRSDNTAMAELLRLLDARLEPIQAQLARLTEAGQQSGALAAFGGAPLGEVAGVAATLPETASTQAEDGDLSPQEVPSTIPAEPGQVLLDQLKSLSPMEDAAFGAAVRTVVQRCAPY